MLTFSLINCDLKTCFAQFLTTEVAAAASTFDLATITIAISLTYKENIRILSIYGLEPLSLGDIVHFDKKVWNEIHQKQLKFKSF